MAAEWAAGFPGAITVTDINGIIIEMNEKACKTFEKYGGKALIGTNLLQYHSEKSQEIIKHIISTGETNTYTIEKNEIKKLIYQAAWYQDGKIKGLVEISVEIPFEMPHFIRA